MKKSCAKLQQGNRTMKKNSTLSRLFWGVACGLIISTQAGSHHSNASNDNISTDDPIISKHQRELSRALKKASDYNVEKHANEIAFFHKQIQLISKNHVSRPDIRTLYKVATKHSDNFKWYKRWASYSVAEYTEDVFDGVLKKLDRHSDYLTDAEWKEAMNIVSASNDNPSKEQHQIKGTRIDGIGYIDMRKSGFTLKGKDQFKNAILDILASSSPLDGVIIDLRGNLGGYLSSAQSMVDDILNEGLINGRTKDGYKITNKYDAQWGDYLQGHKIVILVDHRSASTSEIMAGALKHNERATIIGTHTFGKGTIQTYTPFKGRANGIKLTQNFYTLANNRTPHHTGVTPDIYAQHPLLEPMTLQREKDKSQSLTPPIKYTNISRPKFRCKTNIKETSKLTDEHMVINDDTNKMVPDTQLLCAFDYLKGTFIHTTMSPY